MYCNLGDWFKEKFVLQRYKGIAIQWSAGVQNCIAIQFTGQQCIAIHCTVLWHETGLPVLQDRRLCRDTALGARLGAQAGAGGALGSAGGRCGRVQGAARRGRAGAHGAQAGAWARHRRQAQRAWQARGARETWALGARPRCAGWLRAVHSVHSAYFRPGLTRYCS